MVSTTGVCTWRWWRELGSQKPELCRTTATGVRGAGSGSTTETPVGDELVGLSATAEYRAAGRGRGGV